MAANPNNSSQRRITKFNSISLVCAMATLREDIVGSRKSIFVIDWNSSIFNTTRASNLKVPRFSYSTQQRKFSRALHIIWNNNKEILFNIGVCNKAQFLDMPLMLYLSIALPLIGLFLFKASFFSHTFL